MTIFLFRSEAPSKDRVTALRITGRQAVGMLTQLPREGKKEGKDAAFFGGRSGEFV